MHVGCTCILHFHSKPPPIREELIGFAFAKTAAGERGLFLRVPVPFSLFDEGEKGGTGRRTHPNRVTRPLEEAVMEPSSSMVYSAEMLSCRNRPSGSFFCRAYHLPAYCGDEEEHSRSVCCCRRLVAAGPGPTGVPRPARSPSWGRSPP